MRHYNRIPLRNIAVPVLLASLTVLFYWQIALTGRILPTYDLFTYFYPYKAFVNAALQRAEIPLWNPYIFMGVPALANIQAAVFYPFNLLTIGLEPPQAVNLSILAHVFLGGVFMFAFCRISAALSRPAAALAAIVFMFGGFLSGQIGHINQLNASIWLPLLLLAFDRAYQRRSLTFGVLGAFIFAVQVLAGHPQEAFLSAAALAVFALFRFYRQWVASSANLKDEAKWAAASFALVTALGAGLIAFQALPTAELSGQSIRSGGLPYQEAMSFSLPPRELLRALLPSFVENPYSEFIAYIGIVPLGLLALAFRTRRHPYVLFCGALLVIGLFFAFGAYNPLSPLLYRFLPGLNLFRVPARWLFLYSFGAALGAAIGFDFLITGKRLRPLSLRSSVVRWLVSCLGLEACLAFATFFMALPPLPVVVVWGALIALSTAIFWLGPLVPKRRLLGGILAVGIIGELFFAGADLDMNHLVPSRAYTSDRPTVDQLESEPGLFRILSIASSEYEPGEARREGAGGYGSTRERDELWTSIKYRDILTPDVPMASRIATIDGYDGGLLPLKGYVELKRAIMESGVAVREGQTAADMLLRYELAGIPDTRLLGALNVKYIIDDKRNDVWIDNTYYDLSAPVVLSPDQSLTLSRLPDFPANALGLVTYLSNGGALPQGAEVATISVTDSEGKVTQKTLKAGVDTAEGLYAAGTPHQRPRVAASPREAADISSYYTSMNLDRLTNVREVRITAGQAELHVVGASFIDGRSEGQPLAVNQGLKMVYSGDVKVYENLNFMPRAFLVHQAKVASSVEEARQAIAADIDGRVVLLNYSGPLPSPTTNEGEKVNIISYDSHRIAIDTKLKSDGFLVLSDSVYPGWHAYVDGVEAPILTGDLLLRTLHLSVGEHHIEFRYAPSSLAFGTGISAFSLLIAAALVVIGSRKRRTYPD